MSCNGCRVLRKGCSENCILRPCLQWIDGAEAQGHATVFVAKFFGRAGLMSFISAVPENQRPALFQSLLFEAAGRTVNPVNGAVGLMWTGNWHICQEAVETVLHGGTLRPIADFMGQATAVPPDHDEASEACQEMYKLQNPRASLSRQKLQQQQHHRRRRSDEASEKDVIPLGSGLDLSLTPGYPVKIPTGNRRLGSPSMNSEESVTTTCFEYGVADHQALAAGPKLLDLFH